ncbi:5-(carboxyamino)imidazole ribonucleotide mutase [Natronogracilivirga saccharolytica]|uniref:N5-carboxyaminoimidazole ribonucleotide mutase n=1 Tax=Natronogracilivirga saccharolytica TaxID=2812953 RepID=A0A8J7UW04_9BACT|nr:5-(carboxyamino)imidazole ribonucleotide mutase [Natronogracilivirga saccharolytica]MBP3193126.1 5-(carboxyamino)imidazole ribonucleotide mutase [Natronogracilivirga saccharolytica]
MKEKNFRIGIIMGSDSDWPVMKAAAEICGQFDADIEKKVVSAHRTPDLMAEYARTARERGIGVIIAGAGGAAHLPGMVAAHTTLPVIGVPVSTRHLKGMDSLLSIVQMPRGVPVATVAIDNAMNAGLLALQILSLQDQKLAEHLSAWRKEQQEASVKKSDLLQ